MSSTHLSLYFHIVFSTKYRVPIIGGSWRERLHDYLGGIIRGLYGSSIAVGGTEDHVHVLASLRATHRLADVVRDLKSSSSKWVHENIGNSKFDWQDGYGGFSVSRSEVETIRKYIRNQKEHHRKRTFQEEYLELLRDSGVEYDERFLW